MYTTDLLSLGNSTELARVMVSIDDRECLSRNNHRFRLDSGTKIYKFWSCVLFIFIYFRTCGAEEFKEIILKRWSKLRKEPSTKESHILAGARGATVNNL